MSSLVLSSRTTVGRRCKHFLIDQTDFRLINKFSMFLRSVGSGVESGPVRSWSLIRIGLGTDLDLFDPFFFRSWHWSWSFWSDLRLAQNWSGPVLIRSGLWSDLFLIRRSPKHRKKVTRTSAVRQELVWHAKNMCISNTANEIAQSAKRIRSY